MKKIIATTAVVLGLAAPAFAAGQLAADLNVPANEYTTAQLVQLHFIRQLHDATCIVGVWKRALPA